MVQSVLKFYDEKIECLVIGISLRRIKIDIPHINMNETDSASARIVLTLGMRIDSEMSTLGMRIDSEMSLKAQCNQTGS